MKMDCYPQYKSSNINWIGDIPDHWSLKKIKYICKNYDSKRIPLSGSERAEKSGDYPYYGATGVIDYVDDYIFDGEYILIGEDGAPFFENNRDVAFIASNKFWVNNHAHILKANLGLSQKIIVHQLNCVQYKEYISGSTRDKLTQDELKEIVLPFIPLSEQQSIAAFLDYKTEQIDKLIEKKEQLLKLLEEKRIALITQAVTKGLDPNVKMKPSGIDWLGDIPEQWVVKRLKRVSALFGRIGFRGYSTEDIVDEMEGAITLSPSNMVDGKLDLTKCTYLSWDKYNESPEIQIKDGDILLVKTGSTIGKIAFVHIVEYPMTINPQIAVFKKINCVKKYLYYYLISSVVLDQFRLSNTGSTIPTMTQETIGNYAIPLPLEAEQKLIVAYIEAETKKIEKLFDQITLAIIRLKEYRTSLITAAVTGKIDVRDFKPPREE